MKNKVLHNFFKSSPFFIAKMCASALALQGCGFARTLLLEPFDNGQPSEKILRIAAPHSHENLTLRDSIHLDDDIQILKDQMSTFQEKATVENLKQALQRSSLLTATPSLYQGLTFKSFPHSDEFLQGKKELERSGISDFAILPNALFIKDKKPLFYLTQSSVVNLGSKHPLDTELQSVTLKVRNHYARALQSLKVGKETQYNIYQVAVQCAYTEVTYNSSTRSLAWPRLVSLEINTGHLNAQGTQRFVFVSNRLALKDDKLTAPLQWISATARPHTNAARAMALRIKIFEYLKENESHRYEYHRYFIPFFSRFWATEQTAEQGHFLFTNTVPKGKSLVLKGASQTGHDTARPSPAQVDWLASFWKNPEADKVPAPSATNFAVEQPQIYNEKGHVEAFKSDISFESGLFALAPSNDPKSPNHIDKLMQKLPSPGNFWNDLKFNADFEKYNIQEFIQNLPSQCTTLITTPT